MSFLSTGPSLARALAERNYDESTPVQAAVLADDAVGRDLLVSAQTGSGKTVAYGLAIAENLLEGAEKLPKAGSPLALIVAPTRELALQVHGELTWLYQYAGARVVSCVGGMDPRKEQRELAAGAHIVVGTPGRLCDHLRRNRLDVSELKAVVLDEAERNARHGLSRGHGVHPQDHAGIPPYAAVLGDAAARHRQSRQAVSAAGVPRRSRRHRRRSLRHRISRDPDFAERRRTRCRQRAPLF